MGTAAWGEGSLLLWGMGRTCRAAWGRGLELAKMTLGFRVGGGSQVGMSWGSVPHLFPAWDCRARLTVLVEHGRFLFCPQIRSLGWVPTWEQRTQASSLLCFPLLRDPRDWRAPLTSGAMHILAVACPLLYLWSLKPLRTLTLVSPPVSGSPSHA